MKSLSQRLPSFLGQLLWRMTNLLPGKFHRNRMKSIIASLYKEIITDKMVSFLVVELNRICTLLKLKNFLNLKKTTKKLLLSMMWLFRNNKKLKAQYNKRKDLLMKYKLVKNNLRAIYKDQIRKKQRNFKVKFKNSRKKFRNII